MAEMIKEDEEVMIEDTNKVDEQEKDMLVQADFSEKEETEVVEIIENEMARIQEEYAAIDWLGKIEYLKKKFETSCGQDTINTSTGMPNIEVAIQKMITRLLAARAVRQTINADPMIVMSKQNEIETDELSDRQEVLDFVMRKKLDYALYIKNDYERGIYMPCTITKTSFRHSEENRTKVVEFSANNLEDFKEVYGDEVVKEGTEAYEDFQKIQNGETVIKEVNFDKTTYHGACIYNVPLEKFGARISIKDFRQHTLIYEQLDYNWLDLYAKKNDPKSGWMPDRIDEIIANKVGKDDGDADNQNALHEAEFTLFECVLQYDRNKNGIPQRYIIVIDSETKLIAKAIHYPQDNICYTSRSVNPKDNSWAGESLLNMINEVVAILNSVFNSYIYENDLAHTPIIMTDDTRAITKKAISLGKINIIPFSKGSTYQQLRHELPSQDRVAFFNMLMQLAFLLCGVDPMLVGGAQSVNDPNAGVGKTALKLQATSQRMKDMIINLQYADAQIAEQVENIEYEYRDVDEIYYKDRKIDLTKITNKSVLYRVHGSEATFDRQQDLAMLEQIVKIVTQLFPGVWADPNVKKSLLNTIINTMGGTVEQMRDTIIEPLDNAIEVKEIIEKARKIMQGQGVQGVPQQEVGAQAAGAQGQQVPEVSGGAGMAQPTSGGEGA